MIQNGTLGFDYRMCTEGDLFLKLGENCAPWVATMIVFLFKINTFENLIIAVVTDSIIRTELKIAIVNIHLSTLHRGGIVKKLPAADKQNDPSDLKAITMQILTSLLGRLLLGFCNLTLTNYCFHSQLKFAALFCNQHRIASAA